MLPVSEQLQIWIEKKPAWSPADDCLERIENFFKRTQNGKEKFLRTPHLVVAMLGGTGTGKSTLINALLGSNVVTEGKERPTTHEPVLVCHTNTDVSEFQGFRINRQENLLLERIILIDCPDPDTTEKETENEIDDDSNLMLLRKALPYCDVLLVTATQQKYRSRRVLDELTDAAPGARLVFVQTHADRDIDIREDWKTLLQERYETGQMFFVESKENDKNNADASEKNDNLAALRRLLTQELSGTIAKRIRLANYYSLAEETVAGCGRIIDANGQAVQKLRERIIQERRNFGTLFAEKMQGELKNDRQVWESKLITRLSAQWGYSPFSLLLRLYQSLGSLASGALLARARSPIQLAVWGTFEGVRQIRNRKQRKKSAVPPMTIEEENQLKSSTMILNGYIGDARLTDKNDDNTIQHESGEMYENLIEEIAEELDTMTSKLAERHNKIRFRFFFETLLSAMLLFLLARPAKNFFIDSFFYHEPLFGIDYYLVSLFWLTLWCAVLLGLFTFSLRKGITGAVQETAQDWNRLPALDLLFAALEKQTSQVIRFRKELDTIKEQLDTLNTQAAQIDHRLGFCRN